LTACPCLRAWPPSCKPMDLLGGYCSDDDPIADQSVLARRLPKETPAGQADAPRKRVIHFSRLPTARPLPAASAADAAAALGDEEDGWAPPWELDLSAPGPRRRPAPEPVPCSVASLPAPQASGPGDIQSRSGGAGVSEASGAAAQVEEEPRGSRSDEVRVDFVAAGRPQEKPRAAHGATAWLVQAPRAPDPPEPEGRLPEALLRHPMLRGRGAGDGPSPEEAEHLASLRGVAHVRGSSLADPNWRMSGLISGGPGLHPGKTVPAERSMYDADGWQRTTHADPSRTQKRKHQINWLAHDAIQREAELMDRAVAGRMSKAQTMTKYGW